MCKKKVPDDVHHMPLIGKPICETCAGAGLSLGKLAVTVAQRVAQRLLKK